MSITTLTRPDDDFDRWERELATQPLGEPEPEPTRSPRQRRSRAVERSEAIGLSLGIRRHRTSEKEA